MKLKPIRNDREMNRALKRIDELWGAKSNTKKGDELEYAGCLNTTR
jgi:HTH-type transcriptional regulator/antitoxin HigA